MRHDTARWGELQEPWLLGAGYLTNDEAAQVKHVAHDSTDRLSEAAEDVLGMNRHQLNAYATVNPVSATNRPSVGKRASKEHIVASFFHWADADSAEAAQNIRSFVGPKPTFTVLTGTQPCARPHVYWELEDPARNFDAWTATQKNIAAHLGTDAAVVDPPRIMRLAGTINWPKPKKLAKGYVAETTSIHIHDPDTRPPVTSDQMVRAFPSASRQSSEMFATNIEGDGKTAADFERILEAARTDGEKHAGVRDLTASLAGQGVSKALAEAIVRQSCPVWDNNVQALLDSAYEKFYAPDLAAPLSEEQKAEIPAAMFSWWQPKNLSAIPAPEFLYSDFYARGYTSLTVAAPKVGKSMLGLAEAIDAATGRGMLTGVQREPMRVVYYNAEDDQNVIDGRVSALLSKYNIDQSEITGRLAAVSGIDRDDFYMVSGIEGVINEALFVSLEKFCSEQGADLLIFDPLQDLSRSPETNEIFRLLGQRLRRMASTCNVGLGLIHHTRKVAVGTTPTIDDARGGGAIRGTARFNRILVPMTEEEALKAGVESHHHFLRIGDIESNLAPPSADVNRWFEKTSVLAPNGQYIGAIAPWQWPDAFDGVSPQDARRVQLAVAAMEDNPPLESNRSPTRWVGVVVADVLGWDVEDRATKTRIGTLVKTWVKSGVLEVVEFRDTRAGRDRRAVFCGPNNPASEENGQ